MASRTAGVALLVGALVAVGGSCTSRGTGGGDDGGDDDGGDDGYSVDAIEELCRDACVQEQTCYPEDFALDYRSVEQCADECIATIAEVMDAECLMAGMDLGRCVVGLSCTELDDYYAEPTPGYPCNEEDARVDAACS